MTEGKPSAVSSFLLDSAPGTRRESRIKRERQAGRQEGGLGKSRENYEELTHSSISLLQVSSFWTAWWWWSNFHWQPLPENSRREK